MKVYFIGIGGIGVSALARYYLHQGAQVFGSDLFFNETIEELKDQGAMIFVGEQKAKNLPTDLDLVVYSLAVCSSNPERKKALELKKINKSLKVFSYPQALGKISQQYFTIAVSGVHGKSTTAAMVTSILITAGLDPTIFIGTKIKELSEKNFRIGKSQYLILEADEWRASLLNYFPQALIITNIEEDHLDFYHNLEEIIETYQKMIDQLPAKGVLIVNEDNPAIHHLKIPSDIKTISYSLTDPVASQLKKVLKVPGEYNLSNALASYYLAQTLGVSEKDILQGLTNYQGCWRRFDQRLGKLENKDFVLVYDYAHHPTALKSFLKALREKFPQQKILAIFQPHQYERTVRLADSFIQALKESEAWVDQLIITDIYKVAGREGKGKGKIKAKDLVEAAQSPSVVFKPLKKLKGFLLKEIKGKEIVAVIGAGDIYEWGRSTLEKK
jgi:UDP-N-acetylmuramate--alanine ligase